MLNPSKAAFIVCANNEQYLDECLFYISRLHLPEGMEVETFSVVGAKSMAAGYNEAMHTSDAKYKIYLHQDCFLTNPDFLAECLKIFQSDPEVGMIGALGGSVLPENASGYNHWDTGWIHACNGDRAVDLQMERSGVADFPWYEVEAVDGMLIATSRDLEWREDLFDAFDFYDVSQSTEFVRAGFRLAVPAIGSAICYHDCGYSKLVAYDRYRRIFCEAYGGRFRYDRDRAVDSSQREAIYLAEMLFGKVSTFLDAGRIAEGFTLLDQVDGRISIFNNGLTKLCRMRDVFRAESEGRRYSFPFGEIPSAELIRKYDAIRFLLRRVEYGLPEEVFAELLEALGDGQVSREALEVISAHNVLNRETVARRLKFC